MIELTKNAVFSCLESVDDYPHDWQTDFRALEPGKNQFLLQETVAPSLAIRLGTFTGASIHRGEVPREAFTYSILMNHVDGHFFRGEEAETCDLMAFGANREVDTASGAASSICTISVEREYLEELSSIWGTDIDLESSRVTSLRQCMPDLVHAISMLTRLEEESSAARSSEQLLWQETLATILLGACQAEPTPCGKRANGYNTVRRALDYVEQNISGPIRLSEMCNELGVSVRTLQLQFKKYLNVTPKRAVEQMRLACLRRRLLAEAGSNSTVSEVAFKQGYSHLSQLAQDYFKAFAELPSQTLNDSRVFGGR